MADLIIRDQHQINIELPAQNVDRVVMVNCSHTTVNCRRIRFNPTFDPHIPLFEIRGGSHNQVFNITHQNNYSHWSPSHWEQARRGVVVGGTANKVIGTQLAGVRFGIELIGLAAQAYQSKVVGFSYDAVRINASRVQLVDSFISGSYLANPENHNDGIQLFPTGSPEQQSDLTLESITIKQAVILNDSRLPSRTWMQGCILTDGKVINSHFEDIFIQTDHQHGFTLAEAHDCQLIDVQCCSPDEAVTSHISVNTRKHGYGASRNVKMVRPRADMVLVN